MIRHSLVLGLMLVACGGDDGGGAVDAPPGADAAPSTIQVVEPCAGETATVTADNSSFVYSPAATTITAGQIVKFVMPSTHDVAPKTTADDSGLRVNFNQTKCLKFTTAGVFNFKCTPHGFTGKVTVN